QRASVGVEVSNKKSYFNNVLFEKNYLQDGAYYGQSYLDIKGEQLHEMGLTFGYGVNSKKNLVGLHLGLDIGQRGTQQNGLIKENYVNFTISVSYRDFWRTRGAKYF
ncbi:MAG TPA: hypothetical protein VL307_11345, partial [Chitinophagaceae bacterium]|nr:hypothetical protein [Chitinophagaceae bacterium]